jgi:hypothetical protein
MPLFFNFWVLRVLHESSSHYYSTACFIGNKRKIFIMINAPIMVSLTLLYHSLLPGLDLNVPDDRMMMFMFE